MLIISITVTQPFYEVYFHKRDKKKRVIIYYSLYIINSNQIQINYPTIALYASSEIGKANSKSEQLNEIV